MTQAEIATAIARTREKLLADPQLATSSRDKAAVARLEDGLRMVVEGPGDWSVTTDMPYGMGGAATAPSPGWFFRAAHASCVASLIGMRAAELGIELDSLAVRVDSQSDTRGILALDPAVLAGPNSIRVEVAIDAAGADAAVLRDLVSWSVTHSPVDAVARRPIEVEVIVNGTESPAPAH